MNLVLTWGEGPKISKMLKMSFVDCHFDKIVENLSKCPLFFQPRFDLDPEDVKVQLRRGSAPLEDNDKDLESGLAKTHRSSLSSASARQKAGGGGGIAAVLNSLGEKLGEQCMQ